MKATTLQNRAKWTMTRKQSLVAKGMPSYYDINKVTQIWYDTTIPKNSVLVRLPVILFSRKSPIMATFADKFYTQLCSLAH